MDNDRIHVAIDEAVNALQAAILLAAKIEADQRDLRAIDRAARALVALTPTTPMPQTPDPEAAMARAIEDLYPIDALILLEGAHSSPFIDSREKPPHPASRRLLRVGITRARTLVRLVRPHNAPLLTGGAA